MKSDRCAVLHILGFDGGTSIRTVGGDGKDLAQSRNLNRLDIVDADALVREPELRRCNWRAFARNLWGADDGAGGYTLIEKLNAIVRTRSAVDTGVPIENAAVGSFAAQLDSEGVLAQLVCARIRGLHFERVSLSWSEKSE